MKIKLIHKILSSFLVFLSLGCSEKFEPADPELFYDIVYIALYSRLPDVGSWVPVQGEFRIKFTQDTSGETKDGVFTMAYSSYIEPQFCAYNLSCVCSGGLTGKFLNIEDEVSEEDTDSPYDVFDTYQGDMIDPTTGEVIEIKTFKFDIKIEETNLAIGCKGESDRTVVISRFEDGSLVMLNDYREIYLVPEVALSVN